MATLTVPYNYTPRDYQMPFLRAMDNGCKRAVKVWHRRAGKDKTDLNFVVKRAVQHRGYYPYFFPTSAMGRKVLWDGMDKSGFKFIDHIPEQLIANRNTTEMKVTLRNGSIIQVVGTDNIENVGVNPIGCIFSEYSLQSQRAWDLTRPILAENGGWAIFNFTPRGTNHAYDLLKMAQANDKWFAEVLTVDDTGAISPEAIQEERDSGMSEDMIQQEFYCSFERGQEGSYYGKYMSQALLDGRICGVPFDPAARVITAWDIGVGDSTAIWFCQQIGGEIHLIDYYERAGEGLAHYASMLDTKRQENNWIYQAHYAPHDIEARELNTGLSRKDYARQLGIHFTTLPKLRVEDGIEAVRAILPRCWFDERNCAAGIKALENYRKRFDERHNVYSNVPLHDWASHGADAFRYLAVAIKQGSQNGGSMTAHQAREMYEQYARPVVIG
jgi:hypothetical protein